ncbi:hypothetical protein [Streptomyces virginiae]
MAAAGMAFAMALTGCGDSGGGPEKEASGSSASPGSLAPLNIVHAAKGEPALPPDMPSVAVDPSKAPAREIGGAVLRADGSATYPLDAYQRVENQKTLTKAVNMLAGSCMKTKGFEFPARLHEVPHIRVGDPAAIHGVVNLDSAKVNGYRSTGSEGLQRLGLVNPEAVNGREPTKEERETARGQQGAPPEPGKQGCIGEARATLDGALADQAADLVIALAMEADVRTREDSRVKQAVSKWSACMKAAGFDYVNPTDPGHDKSMLGKGLAVPAGAQLAPPSPFEINVAVTDIGCKRTSLYLETATAVTAAYQKDLIERNAQQLHQNDGTWTKVLQGANKILAAGQ